MIKSIKGEVKNIIDVLKQDFEEECIERMSPQERKEYELANDKYSIIKNKIKKKLPEEFHYLLDKFEQANSDCSSVIADVYFANGFKIGTSIGYITIPGLKEKKILENAYKESIKKVI